MHHTYSLHTAFFYSFLTLRTASPEESHETEMYIVTVKKFLATVTSYRNCNSHTLLWQIMQSPLISLTHLYTTHTTHPIYIHFFHLFIYIRYHSRMDISDEDLLNEDSLLVPATQQTQSPNSFSSGLIRWFSLKSSQAIYQCQQRPSLTIPIVMGGIIWTHTCEVWL